MRILLLAQGDSDAKDLLRAAIEARYGPSPPVIETLRVDFKGRARVKLGPIKTWVPVDMTTHFRFPDAMRLDFTVKPLGLSIQRGIEAYDGTTYRSVRGGNSPTVISEDNASHSIRRRLWAIAAVLLTPIGEMFVKLSAMGNSEIEALNTKLDDAVRLHLRDDNGLEYVYVACLNPDTGKEQVFKLQLTQEQTPIDNLMLPKKVSAFWDDDVYFEVEPLRAENNPPIADGVFTLEADI